MQSFTDVSGQIITKIIVSRRKDDPTECVSDPRKIKRVLNWKSKLTVKSICEDHWAAIKYYNKEFARIALKELAIKNTIKFAQMAFCTFWFWFLLQKRDIWLAYFTKSAAERAGEVGAYFLHKTVMIPSDNKRWRMGEDAAKGGNTLLVVADGVGGWANKGVDPGIFTRDLVSGIHKQHRIDPIGSLKDYLKRQVRTTSRLHKGSCTICIIKIESTSRISTLTMGDAGYALFHVDMHTKKLEMYYRSQE